MSVSNSKITKTGMTDGIMKMPLKELMHSVS